jgi:hypothetical protein
MSGIPQNAFSGPLTDPAVSTLLDSPIRKEIAKRILAGESAVWILLESGIKQQDEEAAHLLDSQLRRMTEKLEVSMPGTELDGSNSRFSTVRVSRDDPLEATFVEMLLRSEPELATLSEPMAIPVFGRGRALFALVGEGIHEDNIEHVCRFLTAWCSCQVKELNPGVDLLMSVDWSRLVESNPLLSAVYTESIAEEESFEGLKRNVLFALLALILSVAIVASVMIWRQRRRDHFN